MPRVITKKKSSAGKPYACGKCRRPIEPGEDYRSWSFRYGGTYRRCFRPECAPRPSELTQSLMSSVYAAQEEFSDGAPYETVADVVTAVEMVRDAAEEVREQYEAAAEPFGGQGEHQDRADELESWISDLESFSPEDDLDGEDALEDAAAVVEAAFEEAEQLVGGCPL